MNKNDSMFIFTSKKRLRKFLSRFFVLTIYCYSIRIAITTHVADKYNAEINRCWGMANYFQYSNAKVQIYMLYINIILVYIIYIITIHYTRY